MAMWPAAAVSALVFGHKKADYFSVGAVDKDQVHDYAKRKGEDVAVVEKWIGTVLAYEP